MTTCTISTRIILYNLGYRNKHTATLSLDAIQLSEPPLAKGNFRSIFYRHGRLAAEVTASLMLFLRLAIASFIPLPLLGVDTFS